MRTWKEMNSEQRYKIVEMVKDGVMSMKEICEMCSVSRTTLNKAVDTVEQAAMEALEPKSPGRRKKEENPLITQLTKENESLKKKAKDWEAKFRFMEAYNDVMSKPTEKQRTKRAEQLLTEEERRQRRNKKKRLRKKKSKPAADTGRVVGLFEGADGTDNGNKQSEFDSLGETSSETDSEKK